MSFVSLLLCDALWAGINQLLEKQDLLITERPRVVKEVLVSGSLAQILQASDDELKQPIEVVGRLLSRKTPEVIFNRLIFEIPAHGFVARRSEPATPSRCSWIWNAVVIAQFAACRLLGMVIVNNGTQ